ncbi:MAG: PAS domain S-box protein [Firmicutes bacterium]|nr:PAS domain S-box protein [Bacillota bacterium]
MAANKSRPTEMVGRFTIDEINKAHGEIFYTAVDTMYIFDVDTLQILDMNPSGLRLLGYTLEEIRTKDFFDIHAIEERARAQEIIDIYRREGGIYQIRDLHLRRKDGTLIPVEKNGRSVEINGKLLGH